MSILNKADISLGFWIAVGFFLAGALFALLQWLFMRARKAAADG